VTTDEFGVPGPRYLACFGTLLWLAEEGYLRYDEAIRMDGIDQAVLTARCFSVLTLHAGGAAPSEGLTARICRHGAGHLHPSHPRRTQERQFGTRPRNDDRRHVPDGALTLSHRRGTEASLGSR
jgi:hypothetical protein